MEGESVGSLNSLESCVEFRCFDFTFDYRSNIFGKFMAGKFAGSDEGSKNVYEILSNEYKSVC